MYRVRIFNEHGQLTDGVFDGIDEACAHKDRLQTVYDSHPDRWCLAVVERFAPTRPLLREMRALAQQLAAVLGETDRVLRLVQHLPAEEHRLAAYDALMQAISHLGEQVYEEEGHN